MRLKTFRAYTLDEALEAVHADFGADAAILHTRTFRRGGLFGIGGRELVEIIASEVEPDTSILPVVTRARDAEPHDSTEPMAESTQALERSDAPVNAGSVHERQHLAGRARQAYASEDAKVVEATESVAAPDGTAATESPLSSGSLAVDRDRTRALARAMEIRLERQRAAREAAGVQNADDLIGDEVDERSTTVHEPEETAAPSTVAPTAPRAEVDLDRSSSRPSVSAPTSFVIGPGGVLTPEGEEEAPRVISLEPAAVTQATSHDIPVASAAVETATTVESAPAEVPPVVKPVVPVVPVVVEEVVEERVVAEGDEPSEPTPAPEAMPTGATDPELREIGETVRRVLDQDGPAVAEPADRESLGFSDPLASAYAEMIGQEFSKDLADRVVETLEDSLDEHTRRDPAEVRKALLREIADLVPTEESLEVVVPRDGRPRTIAFVGPTGVGKTTTLAKIAATLSLREGLKVGLVTADTYRISAVEQLRTYAEILGCRLEVAGDSATMKKVLADCGDLDAVLIDTPGRSQNDADSLAELRRIMDAARPHETHLVLAGTAAERVLLREAEAFAGLGPDRVVLTKLDEAVAFGMLVSVVRRIGRRISWVTTGQEVPRDVEWATGSRIADLVLGGAVKS